MKKIGNVFWLMFGIIMIGYFIYLVGKRFRTDHIPENNVTYAKAIIINNRNYNINHRATSEFTYSYSFIVNGTTYTGNSQDQTLKIGDTVEIEYNKNNPSLNKPLHPKE
jgi:FtsP/CotA-like multicopper oxidase with cupredoxin domain